MIAVCFCVLVALLFTSAECNQFRSDYTFDSSVNGWFKYQRIPAVWHDAWLRCHLEGAVLASPTNMLMNMAMRNVIRSSNARRDVVFTGINALMSKGDFTSVGGYPLSKMTIEWASQEPDNKNNNEDCILFAVDGTIADENCKQVHPYMCFKKKTRNMVLNERCGTYDPEYKFEPRTGSCYKVHNMARNWTRAFMTCLAEDAHLAIINSDTEAIVLKEIFANSPQNPANVVHLGFQSIIEHGVFTTVDGRSLVEAGYSSWAQNQPDNDGGQYCGAMFHDGQLDDIWCSAAKGFICEKGPDSSFNDEF